MSVPSPTVCVTSGCSKPVKTQRSGLCSACEAWTARHDGADPSARPSLTVTPAKCTVAQCGKPVRVKARGWCQACYEWWRQGKGNPAERFAPRLPTKVCGAKGCSRTFRSTAHVRCVPCRRWSARHDGASPDERASLAAPDAACAVEEGGALCGKPVFSKRNGWCRMHYTRWARNGDPRVKRVAPHTNTASGIMSRAAAITPDTNGCRISTGVWGCDRDGYPVTRLDGKRRRVTQVIIEAATGRPLGKGEQANHHCDEPRCVELTHLFAGTHDENMADMVAKGRKPRGKDIVTVRLTAAQVRTIRADYARHAASQKDLAERYGISQRSISHIVRRVTWASLD